MAKTPTWQRAAGKNPEGGLNEAGRRSLRAAGHDIKRPQPEGGSRKKSFCARMKGMKAQNTSAETANDPNSRINKSLRKWKCADGGEITVDNALRMARGRPDEGGQERFLREQLAGSAPQYDPQAGIEAAKEAGRMAATMTPPGAIADAAGYLGGPSALQNVRQGNYGTAALQLAGALPGVGPLAKAAKIAEEAQALRRASEIIHNQKVAPKIENLARGADKFVYHSGVRPDIEHMTPYLEPQHGSWVREVAAGASDEFDPLENAMPLVWMSDKPNWVVSKVGRHLKKPFDKVTDEDIKNFGHVALIPRKSYEAENIWRVGEEGLSEGPYSQVTNLRTGKPEKAYATDIFEEGREPFGVERNEYISAQPVEPMYHLTGDALLNFLRLTKNRADGGAVENALRIARQDRSPMRLHQTLARTGYAEGGVPDEASQEKFLKEQLQGSAPQYEPSQDFPARAERAVQAADRYAGVLNDLAVRGAGLPKEFQSPQGRSAREIVESALPQDPNAIVKQAMRQAGEGNRLAAAETMLGGIPETGAIRAYHGSPHRFDRFDISKIGTGEGAQAYGHGLYFAESEPVARSYRDALSGAVPHDVQLAMKSLDNLGYNSVGTAIANARLHPDWMKRWDVDPTRSKTEELAANIINKHISQPRGHMYEVEIAAEPHQLLDWDKPLSEQSRQVRESVMPFIESPLSGTARNLMIERANIPDIVNLRSPKVTKELNARGIPGIQYLDQGSRAVTGGQLIDVFQGPKGWQSRVKVSGRGGTGFQSPTDSVTTSKPFLTEAEARDWANSKINSGTRNFVIFDPSLIDIKRRYAEGGDVTVDNALRMARNMGGGTLYNQLNYALNSPTPANPPQDPGPQQPYYQSLAQTRDIVQQYGTPAPGAPTSSAVRQPMPYADGGEVQQMVEEFKSPHSEQNLGMMSALPIDNSGIM